MGILEIFIEVCDKRSPSMACLSRSQSFSCHGALPTEALLEEAAVRALSGACNLCVEDEVDGTIVAIPARMPVSEVTSRSRLLRQLISMTQISALLDDALLLKHETTVREREALLALVIVDGETRAGLILDRHQ